MIQINTSPSIESKAISKTLPEVALIFHKRSFSTSVATKHPIVNGKLSKGSIVSSIQLKELLGNITFEHQQKSVGFINPNVLLDNDKYLIWHKPRFTAPMWFSVNNKKPKAYRVEWTSMVFVVDKVKSTLSICATSTNTRPTLSSKVYLAPIFNLSNNGSFCLGSARLPKTISASSIKACEDCVIESQFTHHNTPYLINGANNDCAYFDFLREKETSGKRIYAKEMLKMKQTTLETWLNAIGVSL